MFDSHKLNDQGLQQVTKFKTDLAKTIKELLPLMPNEKTRDIFMQKIDEAVFFGTKAIASKYGNYTEVTTYGEDKW